MSKVIFIHDYIQLVFGDDSFSIYNQTELISGEKFVQFGLLGFCDGLVSNLGLSLVSVSYFKNLSLTFENGSTLVVAPTGAGPEAWQFNSSSGTVTVEQNA